jgi:hypothetical protein
LVKSGQKFGGLNPSASLSALVSKRAKLQEELRIIEKQVYFFFSGHNLVILRVNTCSSFLNFTSTYVISSSWSYNGSWLVLATKEETGCTGSIQFYCFPKRYDMILYFQIVKCCIVIWLLAWCTITLKNFNLTPDISYLFQVDFLLIDLVKYLPWVLSTIGYWSFFDTSIRCMNWRQATCKNQISLEVCWRVLKGFCLHQRALLSKIFFTFFSFLLLGFYL